MVRGMVLPAMMVTIAVLTACGGTADTPVPATTTPTRTPRPTFDFPPRPLQTAIEGDGSDLLGPYEMAAGVIIAFVRYEGDGSFSLTFVDEDEGLVKSIDSSPGPYIGERVHSVFEGNTGGLAPGNYTVAVDAAGPWRMWLFQERATSGQSPEIKLTGSGDGGGSWLELEDGEYTMTTSNTGVSDFTVDLFDSQGLPPYRILQATGGQQGEKLFTVGGGAPGVNPQAGFYALGVRSGGDWEVTITSNDAP